MGFAVQHQGQFPTAVRQLVHKDAVKPDFLAPVRVYRCINRPLDKTGNTVGGPFYGHTSDLLAIQDYDIWMCWSFRTIILVGLVQLIYKKLCCCDFYKFIFVHIIPLIR